MNIFIIFIQIIHTHKRIHARTHARTHAGHGHATIVSDSIFHMFADIWSTSEECYFSDYVMVTKTLLLKMTRKRAGTSCKCKYNI